MRPIVVPFLENPTEGLNVHSRPGITFTPICTPEGLQRGLDAVRTPEGIQASNAYHFKGAIFGRDSLQVGLDLVEQQPELVEQIIISLAKRQGTKTDLTTEEEPGRIHHEYRSLEIGGQLVSQSVRDTYYRVGRDDFGLDTDAGEWTYYGAIDATPSFVRLVALHCSHHGDAVLDRQFRHATGIERSIREAVTDATGWVETRLKASDIGLMEFHRTNPRGLRWHVMRDGSTSHLHADGKLANLEAPIAPLDVQGLAYDALLMGGELLGPSGKKQAAAWRKLATTLRDNTLERFWLKDQECFAMALDRDELGRPRPITVPSSVQAELLETGLFDGLPDEDQERYIGAIVRQMYSEEFLTDVGIRMRAVSFVELTQYQDYQGSEVSWVVTSNVFARGLRHQALSELAADIESRYIGGLDITGNFVEFWYVDTDGKVAYFAQKSDAKAAEWHIYATNLPENIQAWTVSAAQRAVWQRSQPVDRAERAAWRDQLVTEIDHRLREPHTAYVDTDKGQKRERAFLSSASR